MAPFLTRIVSSFKMGKFRNKNSKIKRGPNSYNKHSLFGESVWKWVALGCFMRTSFTGIWQGEYWGTPWPFVMCIWSPPLKQKELVFDADQSSSLETKEAQKRNYLQWALGSTKLFTLVWRRTRALFILFWSQDVDTALASKVQWWLAIVVRSSYNGSQLQLMARWTPQ